MRDDQLALALTDWERLLEVGVDLTTSHFDCTAINALFRTRIVTLQAAGWVTSYPAFSRNLQRLGKLRTHLVKIGIDRVIDSKLVAICEALVRLRTASHPALAEFDMVQGVEKSELQRLKDVEQWAATRLAVQSSFPDAKCALGKLDRITGYELRQLSPRAVNSDDSTFLKALELAARIRKSLSSGQHHFIDRIISSKIAALQESKAVTFSSTSPGGSSSSPSDKANNKTDDKTTESKEQVVVLQSKLEELETTIRTLKRDQGVMAEDKVALTRDRDNLALALKTMEDQNIGLRQGSLQEREAYSSLQSASQEQTDSYQKCQIELLKIKEHLLEAHGGKKSTAMDVEKLKAEMSQLSTASDTSGDRAKVFGELLGKFRGEQIRLGDNIQCMGDKLEYAENAYTAVAMDNNKLAAENAHMKGELAKSHDILAQVSIAPSVHRSRASGPDPTVEFLVAEKARLETQLAKANSTLGAISSSLNPFWVAPPASANISETAGKAEHQMDRVRNLGFINTGGPVSEMQTMNTTINTFEPNTNTFSQTPSGDAKNYIGTNNSWGPDAATLTPSTVVDTHDWPMAASGRRSSLSGSIESEL